MTALGERLVLAGLPAALAVALAWAEAQKVPAVAPDPVMIVDPNMAPSGVLLALPRLGPSIVGRIVDERGRGPFGSAADLQARVRRVGPATTAALRPYLRFPATRRPRHPTADRTSIQAAPG